MRIRTKENVTARNDGVPLYLILFFLSSQFLSAPPASALQIKKTESAAVDFSEFDLRGNSYFRSPINPKNSFVYLTAETKSLKSAADKSRDVFDFGEGAGLFSYWLANESFIDISRSRVRKNGGTQARVQYQVVEFIDGIRVHRGVSLFSDDILAKNIAIPTIQTSASFPILSVQSENWSSGPGETETLTATFTDSNTLHLERKDLPSSPERMAPPRIEVNWQIVEFMSGASVRNEVLKFPHYGNAQTADLSQAPIKDLSKVFLIFNYAAGAGANGHEGLILIRGAVTDKKTLTFSRAAQGKKQSQGAEIAWYLVELTDEGSWVQRGEEHFEKTEFSKRIQLQSIDPARSLVIISVSGGPPLDDPAASQALHSFKIRAEITDNNTLSLSRMDDPDEAEWEADVSWQVIEFRPLTVKSPNGGEVLRMGERFDVKWQHAESLERGGKALDWNHGLKILLRNESKRNRQPIEIAAQIPARNDQYAWIVPEEVDEKSLLGNRWRIQIEDSELARGNADSSDGVFAIKGTIKLQIPNGSEIWHVGSSENAIVWNCKGAIGDLSIYYDTKSGLDIDAYPEPQRIASDLVCDESGRGSWPWLNIPDLTSDRVKIKVVQESDPTVYGVSRNDFSIFPKVSFNARDIGSERWVAQSRKTISWNTSGAVEKFNLLYSKNQGSEWTLIAGEVPRGNGSENLFEWDIPRDAIGDQIWVKVESAGEQRILDIWPHDKAKGISILPFIRVTSPNVQGEVMESDNVYPVTWELNGRIDFVKIEYSSDGGQNWTKEAVVRADDRIYRWQVPQIRSSQAKLRLTDMNEDSHADTSDYAFSIVPKSVLADKASQ